MVEGPLSRTPSYGGGEGSAEGEESGFDLPSGTLRAVGGALARNPGLLQPVGFLLQPLSPLDAAGGRPGVLPAAGARQRDQGQVLHRLLFSAAEKPAEHAPGTS